MSIVVGAPFASGLLVVGPTDGATYMYEPASEEILEKTQVLQSKPRLLLSGFALCVCQI